MRNRQKRMSNVADSGEEHSTIWRNVHDCDFDIHGKEFPGKSKFHDQWISLSKKFDISQNWLDKNSLGCAKNFVFSNSTLCFGKIHQHPDANEGWKKRIEWITTSQSCRDYEGINGEPTEFEWNIFPGFDTLQLCVKSKIY